MLFHNLSQHFLDLPETMSMLIWAIAFFWWLFQLQPLIVYDKRTKLWTLKNQKSSHEIVFSLSGKMFKGFLRSQTLTHDQFWKGNFDVTLKMKAKKWQLFTVDFQNSSFGFVIHYEFRTYFGFYRTRRRKRVRVRERGTKENNISLCKKLSGAINNS